MFQLGFSTGASSHHIAEELRANLRLGLSQSLLFKAIYSHISPCKNYLYMFIPIVKGKLMLGRKRTGNSTNSQQPPMQ